MKIVKEFILRDIAGEYVLVPTEKQLRSSMDSLRLLIQPNLFGKI